MQETNAPSAAPAGFINRFIHLSMVGSAAGGALLCLLIHILSWIQIGRAKVSFMIPPSPSSYDRDPYGRTVTFDDPGKPWLCLAAALLLLAFMSYIPRVYRIARRKKSAICSTKSTTRLMAAGGLCFLAGSELKYGVFLLGFLLVAYAYIGHLAYTRWERVRAQLYRD